MLVLIGFNGTAAPSAWAGLIQRVWIVIGWGWLALLGIHLLLAQPTGEPAQKRA